MSFVDIARFRPLTLHEMPPLLQHRGGERAYSSLNGAEDHDEDDLDMLELSDVHNASASASMRSLPSMMPATFHRALNAATRRSANISAEDSDSDDAEDYGGNSHDASNESSLQALLRKKAREGLSMNDDADDKERDLEGQKPAWAASSTSNSSENNVLKVCFARSGPSAIVADI